MSTDAIGAVLPALLVALLPCVPLRADVVVVGQPAAAPAGNNVAFDAATESAVFTNASADPFTFGHTPIGTPKGVMVFVAADTSGLTQITSVSYGGQAMTLVDDAADGSGESGSSLVYFLGTGIPTGAQTVSIDHDAVTASNKWAVCVTVTANGDTSVDTFGILGGPEQTNPSIALDTGATESLRFCVIYSGLDSVSDLTPAAHMTAVHDLDNGSDVFRVDRQTSRASGSVAMSYTAATEDCAMVALAIE